MECSEDLLAQVSAFARSMATSVISASVEVNRAEDHVNQMSLSVWTPVFPIFAAWSARLGPTFIR
jgi:hypothetical protein